MWRFQACCRVGLYKDVQCTRALHYEGRIRAVMHQQIGTKSATNNIDTYHVFRTLKAKGLSGDKVPLRYIILGSTE